MESFKKDNTCASVLSEAVDERSKGPNLQVVGAA